MFIALNKVKLSYMETAEKLTYRQLVKQVTKKLLSAIYSDCIEQAKVKFTLEKKTGVDSITFTYLRKDIKVHWNNLNQETGANSEVSLMNFMAQQTWVNGGQQKQ